MLCTLSARTAAASTAAAASATSAEGLSHVSAPGALLHIMESLPSRSTDVLGIAVEMLETAQAAADALAGREEGEEIFKAVDAAGR